MVRSRKHGVWMQGSMLADVPEKLMGDNRDKIWYLYKKTPEIAHDDALLQLCFWAEFDGLKNALGDKYDDFVEWYLHHATNAESLRRSRQSMTEHEVLPQREHVKEKRAWLAEIWRKYWGPDR